MKGFAVIYNLITLTLGWNSVKSLRLSKIVKENKFKRAWDEVESKKCFAESISYKVSETNSRFYLRERTTAKA